MISYFCDKCLDSIHRRNLYEGRIDNLIDSVFKFELCNSCFLRFRAWLQDQVRGGPQDGQPATAQHQHQDAAKQGVV